MFVRPSEQDAGHSGLVHFAVFSARGRLGRRPPSTVIRLLGSAVSQACLQRLTVGRLRSELGDAFIERGAGDYFDWNGRVAQCKAT
jgi:hypothetical protein